MKVTGRVGFQFDAASDVLTWGVACAARLGVGVAALIGVAGAVGVAATGVGVAAAGIVAAGAGVGVAASRWQAARSTLASTVPPVTKK